MDDLGNNIYRLPGSRGSHIYYIKRENGVLIDTGHPLDDEKNLSLLKNFGLVPDSVKYIVNTHTHFDHIGGTATFINDFFVNAKVVISALSEDYVLKKSALNLYPELEVSFKPFNHDIKVSDYYEIDLGNDIAVLYHTPGHSKDSISLLLKETNTLFTGDLIYKGVITQVDYNYALNQSLDELEKSYELIKNSGIKVICPGHGDVFNPTDKDWLLYTKKIKKFRNDSEIMVINNIIPVLELFFHNNQGIKKDSAIKTFIDYLNRPIRAHLPTGYTFEDIERIIDRAIFLMITFNMVSVSSDCIYLNNKLNAHL
ncbi:MAG: hypothetical protein A2015_06690 [Spirochaetes bacterium GWF1_31_7]|nr:MAG: hypothetical protein A2Y30_09775 [Spirochaetes bacterium GWE1_32_154]OHD46525.1 MAG: hypothetical protein A2015_06690 [Spirochaetes bacterium GWF1_31_7]OHD49334.1 MAG: hypothetical protein A2Y29_03680 [Spirochaetes bacterium GWE2_31_10]